DSEMSCAVMDSDGGTGFAQDLRTQLHREHLDRPHGSMADLATADGLFAAYRECATGLDEWHRRADGSPRPRGRLRTYRHRQLSRGRRMVIRPIYHLVCDPDGRPLRLRFRDRF
ncbi:MAG TPA: hypothetical protein VIC62_24875, partial [Nakamurella sp.]